MHSVVIIINNKNFKGAKRLDLNCSHHKKKKKKKKKKNNNYLK